MALLGLAKLGADYGSASRIYWSGVAVSPMVAFRPGGTETELPRRTQQNIQIAVDRAVDREVTGARDQCFTTWRSRERVQ